MSGSREIKFLDRSPPAQPQDELRDIAASRYGLQGDFQPLDSERDQNFLVETADGKRYVLKVANKDEGADVIEFPLSCRCHALSATSMG
jgi:Ser/Thr protein kinase RdoA (MazF antagonist)